MKKLVFLFTDGSSFSLELPDFTAKSLKLKLAAFQMLCLQMLTDQKRFAGGKTKFTLPLSRPCWIGLDNGTGKIEALRDYIQQTAQLKGYSIVDRILTKDTDGKIIARTLQPCVEFVPFLTSQILRHIGKEQPTLGELGQLDNVFQANEEKRLAAKVERELKAANKVQELPEGMAETKAAIDSVTV